jgi:hypothetical protein
MRIANIPSHPQCSNCGALMTYDRWPHPALPEFIGITHPDGIFDRECPFKGERFLLPVPYIKAEAP